MGEDERHCNAFSLLLDSDDEDLTNEQDLEIKRITTFFQETQKQCTFWYRHLK